MQAKQISFTDIYSDVESFFEEDKSKLIKLLEENIDLSEYIPQEFYNQYYKSTGHPREYKLTCMLSTFILQKILSVTETSVFINVLKLSKELRDFCGFKTVPDHDYRINTIVSRTSEKWIALFKLRIIIERSNYMIKYLLCVANSKLRVTDIIKADLLLACITQQVIVILASKLNKLKEHPLSIKSFAA